MEEIVFSRESSWLPFVTRHEHKLLLQVVGGADALHQPREFSFPIAEAHLAVISSSLTRHLLLYCALTPLASKAGSGGVLDEEAAVALLDPILLSEDGDVDRIFWKIPWDKRLLLAHGANFRLLKRVQLVAALRHATVQTDWSRARRYLGP